MSTASKSLTGAWRGQNVYRGGFGLNTPFLAIVGNFGFQLSGKTDGRGGFGVRLASIVGRRQEAAVEFTKTFAGRSIGFDNTIDFTGTVSENGFTINGT